MPRTEIFILCFLSICLTSCAGPHNPFGAINPWMAKDKGKLQGGEQSTSMLIKTYPQYQIYHRPFDLALEIFDPRGIPEDGAFSVDFYYNGQRVQTDWQSAALQRIGRHNLVAQIKNFRLLPQRKNEIHIIYSRHDNNQFYFYDYKAPECHMEGNESFGPLSDFDMSLRLSGLIKDVTQSKAYSPSFLAGIVAQESSFNPRAVSISKAIGLTQVTSLAQKHILPEKDWPTYPDIDTFSYPRLKYLIMTGKIHAKNEWRLNEKYSLMGGLEYVDYIKNYWSGQSNQKLLKNVFQSEQVPITDLVLASYNSGPYRVKKALLNKGKDWTEYQELNAARHYVAQVKSYCYEFSSDKGDL